MVWSTKVSLNQSVLQLTASLSIRIFPICCWSTTQSCNLIINNTFYSDLVLMSFISIILTRMDPFLLLFCPAHRNSSKLQLGANSQFFYFFPWWKEKRYPLSLLMGLLTLAGFFVIHQFHQIMPHLCARSAIELFLLFLSSVWKI